MSILEIDYGTMENAAESHRVVGDTLTEIEADRAAAVLPPGCLGKILPSEDIVNGFREATEATHEALTAGIELCRSSAERVDLLRALFVATDDHVAEAFDALAGGA